MESQARYGDSSVCRAFYEKFPLGKERVHEELVKFIMSHPDSRAKLDEWLLSKETECRHKEFRPRLEQGGDAYDDDAAAPGDACASGNVIRTSKFSKCELLSKTERELGNQQFMKKNLRISLRHYNQAIRYSPFPHFQQPSNSNCFTEKSNNCLSIALANRSAALYELGESHYDKALMDIEASLAYGYPDRLKTKLILRKASILTKQGKHQTAQECLASTKVSSSQCDNSTATTNLSGDGNVCNDGNTSGGSIIDAKIHALEMQIRELLQTNVPENSDPVSKKLPITGFNENEDFENASNQITIGTSLNMGRHVVAMEDLQEGYILFKEMPFASVLLPEFYESHCHHCHKNLCDDDGQPGEVYFFPCSHCSQVLFCNYQCWNAAQMYHAHECGWLELLHSVGIAHLAVRIILVAGVENILQYARNPSLDETANLQIFKKGMSNYRRVYSLVDHIIDMFEEDLFQYSLTASLLTRFLVEKSSFLEGMTEQQQYQIGGAMLRHICQLVCNAHAVTDILPYDTSTPSVVIDEHQKRIATAIFPAASIMNHSCDPNIMFYFIDGKQLVVKGTRLIRKGENVFNCYGPHFRRMPRNERQEILKQQYFFVCDCNKCEEELQKGISFTDQFQALKCDECQAPIYLSEITTTIPCVNCGRTQNITSKITLLNSICDLQAKGEYFLEQGHIEEAKRTYQSCYDYASHILFKFNSQYGKICDSLARCYVMTGDLHQAKMLLDESLEYVEMRFGKNSLEFTKELQKYQDVCTG